MRWFRKIRNGLLIVSVLTAAIGQTAFAEEPEYYYTVRLYPGKQGTVSTKGISVDSDTAEIKMEGDHVVISNLEYDDWVHINPQESASAKESKYHVRGVRRSGRDNSEAIESAFPVKSDRDYVVAYSVSGELASYTVNYLDADGNALMESDTYYGNPGERQYVSARYVEGYQPQAMNMVKTLDTNEAENVFTFRYTRIQTESTTTETTETTDTEAAPAPEGEGGGTGTGTTNGENAGTNENPEGGTQGVGGDMTDLPDENTPQALQDLDDEEVPLAKYDFGGRPGAVISYLPFYIGIGGTALIALIAAAVCLRKRQIPANNSVESIKEMIDRESRDEETRKK